MKRRLLLYSGLMILLIVVGISTGLMLREYRRQQANYNLIVAIKANNIPTALAAIKAGADPNTPEDVLHSHSLVAIIKQLLGKCFHLHPTTDPKSDKSATALLLHYQVNETSNPILFEALLEAGADPNATYDGITPLMWAAQHGYKQDVRLLLQHGANPRIADSSGFKVLEDASMYIIGESTSDKGECISLLLTAGAEINARDAYGGTALIVSCIGPNDANEEAVRILLQHHADASFQDGNGMAALDYAMERHDPEIIKLLRQAGAKTGRELSVKQVANEH